jgi:hypothetical protein
MEIYLKVLLLKMAPDMHKLMLTKLELIVLPRF